MMAWSRFGFSVAVVWTASLLVAPTSSDRNETSGSISENGGGNDCKPRVLSRLLDALRRYLPFRTGATEDRTEINGYFVDTISMTVKNPSEETEGEFQIKFASRNVRDLRDEFSPWFHGKVIFNKVGHEYKEQLIDPLARDGDTHPLWPADDLSDEGWATCNDIGQRQYQLEIGKGKFKLQCLRTTEILAMSCQIIEADIEAQKVVHDFGNIYN